MFIKLSRKCTERDHPVKQNERFNERIVILGLGPGIQIKTFLQKLG
jgi:hypothetical protein